MTMRGRNVLLAACAALSVALAIVASCSPFHGTSDGDTSDASVATDGGAGGGRADAAAGDDAGAQEAGLLPQRCTALHPPLLVPVGDECIDATEVTYAQYMKMLGSLDGGPGAVSGCAKPSVPGMTPSCTAPAMMNNVPDAPITCVTLCDAQIYCAWAGKHLCGPRDGGSATGPLTPLTDEWTYACTSGGTGSGPDASTCALNPSKLRTVGLGCEGPPGVFDLLGNAEEWTSTPHDDAGEFRTAGDSYMYTGSGASRTCLSDDADLSTVHYPDVGFRCCGF